MRKGVVIESFYDLGKFHENLTLYEPMMHICFLRLHDIIAIRHAWQCPWQSQTGGGGWVHPKGANNMAMYGLGFEKPLVGVG